MVIGLPTLVCRTGFATRFVQTRVFGRGTPSATLCRKVLDANYESMLACPVMSELKQSVADALRYWETRRLVYNGLLTSVALGWLAFTWPHFRPAIDLMWVPPGEQHSVMVLLMALALLANIVYTTAYMVDIPLQVSCAAPWRRWRWVLWLAGTLFAMLFENYWIADEIYPFVSR